VSTKGHSIVVSGIPVEIVRKDIKNLHLGVYPPSGRVRVAAPLRLNDDSVRLAVVTRLGWIRRRQAAFEQQDRQSQREMVTGETHYVQGRRYRLNVIESDVSPGVRVRPNATLEMWIQPKSSRECRVNMLNQWYRRLLHERIPGLVTKWEPHVGVEVAEWGIRRMRTKWGSCNACARRIWINLELAKKPYACLEFIVVHEMVHLLERHHNERFMEQVDRLLPQWRTTRTLLNKSPLSHERWGY
jgi:predicted metal-dependent hydrolase